MPHVLYTFLRFWVFWVFSTNQSNQSIMAFKFKQARLESEESARRGTGEQREKEEAPDFDCRESSFICSTLTCSLALLAQSQHLIGCARPVASRKLHGRRRRKVISHDPRSAKRARAAPSWLRCVAGFDLVHTPHLGERWGEVGVGFRVSLWMTETRFCSGGQVIITGSELS